MRLCDRPVLLPLPQAMFGTPAKTKKSPKEVSDSLEDQVGAVSLEDPLANLPLTSRRGHDVTEENWEERSKRLAELKRRNEEAELNAKMRLGMLSKREQQLLGPVCQLVSIPLPRLDPLPLPPLQCCP